MYSVVESKERKYFKRDELSKRANAGEFMWDNLVMCWALLTLATVKYYSLILDLYLCIKVLLFPIKLTFPFSKSFLNKMKIKSLPFFTITFLFESHIMSSFILGILIYSHFTYLKFWITSHLEVSNLRS